MKPKILIIDDDITTLQILKRHLQQQYDVQIENEGYRFIKNIQEYQADLILLDIEMPIMNGLQVFKEIKKIPSHNQIPILFLTGVAEPQVVMKLMNEGAAGYIIKSATREELNQKISKILLR